MASEVQVISGENHFYFPARFHVHIVVFVTVRMVEVEHEQQVSLLVNQNLVRIVLRPDILIRRLQNVVLHVQPDHLLLKVVQKMVPQSRVLSQVPSSSAVLVGPTVSLAGEIDPLRMPKLVTHECQVPLSAQTEGDEPDHFVKGHAPENPRGFLIEDGHVGVGFGIEEPHGDSFIAYEGLIVTLGISDALLLPPPVGKFVHDFLNVPVFILALFEQFDPHVRNSHGQSVVEAYTSVLVGSA